MTLVIFFFLFLVQEELKAINLFLGFEGLFILVLDHFTD